MVGLTATQKRTLETIISIFVGIALTEFLILLTNKTIDHTQWIVNSILVVAFYFFIIFLFFQKDESPNSFYFKIILAGLYVFFPYIIRRIIENNFPLISWKIYILLTLIINLIWGIIEYKDDSSTNKKWFKSLKIIIPSLIILGIIILSVNRLI